MERGKVLLCLLLILSKNGAKFRFRESHNFKGRGKKWILLSMYLNTIIRRNTEHEPHFINCRYAATAYLVCTNIAYGGRYHSKLFWMKFTKNKLCKWHAFGIHSAKIWTYFCNWDFTWNQVLEEYEILLIWLF